MVAGLDRNSATLMPYYIYIYIYTLVIPLRLAFPRHTLMFMIGRHELNRVLFLCVPQREREREIDIQKGMEIRRSPPLFSQGQRGSLFVLTFASFLSEERASRKMKVENERGWG